MDLACIARRFSFLDTSSLYRVAALLVSDLCNLLIGLDRLCCKSGWDLGYRFLLTLLRAMSVERGTRSYERDTLLLLKMLRQIRYSILLSCGVWDICEGCWVAMTPLSCADMVGQRPVDLRVSAHMQQHVHACHSSCALDLMEFDKWYYCIP